MHIEDAMEIYIASFGLDLVHFLLQAREESLPALLQSLFILFKVFQLQIPEPRGQWLWLVVWSQTGEDAGDIARSLGHRRRRSRRGRGAGGRF